MRFSSFNGQCWWIRLIDWLSWIRIESYDRGGGLATVKTSPFFIEHYGVPTGPSQVACEGLAERRVWSHVTLCCEQEKIRARFGWLNSVPVYGLIIKANPKCPRAHLVLGIHLSLFLEVWEFSEDLYIYILIKYPSLTKINFFLRVHLRLLFVCHHFPLYAI